MKRTHMTVATAMVPLLSVAVYMSAAAAANVQTDTAKTSVAQIRDTLHNLLRSIDDTGREADALFGKRQKWCEGAGKQFATVNDVASASLQDMKAQLTEHDAEIEEAAGTVQQVKVDIEMVQHTIKQTEEMLKDGSDSTQQDGQARQKLLRSLMENKKLSLSSLQGELEVAIPVLAQLQASAAETKQRISYRTDSLAAGKDFLSTLRDVCQAGADRADTQAAARLGESNAVHTTLQALDQVDEKRAVSQDSQSDAPLSFVQLGDRSQEMTVDDLSDLFSDQHASTEPEPAPVVRQVALPQHEVRRVSSSSSMRPRIEALMSQLKEAGSTSDQTTWCSDQREGSELALKFSQDSVAQLSSEVDAHSASEVELSEELSRLQSSAAAAKDASNKASELAKKEQAFIQSSQKDQVLAIKILGQATTILKDLGVTNATVAHGLDSAQKMLRAQIKAADGFVNEAIAKASVIADMAAEFARTQESEQHTLEFARDDHASQRLNNAENQRLYEADVKEAAAYVQKLQESCKFDTEVEAKRQRSTQVHALEDADQALDGKLMEAKTTASSLRGVEPKSAPKALTPMQRAAAEMGLSVD